MCRLARNLILVAAACAATRTGALAVGLHSGGGSHYFGASGPTEFVVGGVAGRDRLRRRGDIIKPPSFSMLPKPPSSSALPKPPSSRTAQVPLTQTHMLVGGRAAWRSQDMPRGSSPARIEFAQPTPPRPASASGLARTGAAAPREIHFAQRPLPSAEQPFIALPQQNPARWASSHNIAARGSTRSDPARGEDGTAAPASATETAKAAAQAGVSPGTIQMHWGVHILDKLQAAWPESWNDGWYQLDDHDSVPWWSNATWRQVAEWVDVDRLHPEAIGYHSEPADNGRIFFRNGTRIVALDEDAQAAQQLATSEAHAATEKANWMPLGIYVLSTNPDEQPVMFLQLAIAPDLQIRGRYFHAVSKNVQDVHGAADPQTQQVAWTIGRHKETVFETGLHNLTTPQTPVLVHFGGEKLQLWMAVRLPPPAE